MNARALVGLVALLAPACAEPAPPGPEPRLEAAAGAAAAGVVAAPEAPVGQAPCPADMALVEGLFCPEVDQRCLEHHPEYVADPETSERCLAFAEPSRCVARKRVLVRFCIDHYEWPNQKGELPSVLVDWNEARESCEQAGKRLCDEDEWVFACEGEEMRPYVNGYKRDAEACVIDRPYVSRPRVLARWDACQASATCRADFERVDQRAKLGENERCASPEGVFDLNGNVNEWVNVPGEKAPRRSALKGGWWGPVRDRCRPTVRFHDEADWGYEIGFRCCRDATP